MVPRREGVFFPGGGVVATSAHIMQTLTDLDAEATVLAIDGVGAHDLISRQAMREGLQGMERDQILPFVGMFYGVHRRTCGKGNSLMPPLFAFGLHEKNQREHKE